MEDIAPPEVKLRRPNGLRKKKRVSTSKGRTTIMMVMMMI
jgi:hypothetical protein